METLESAYEAWLELKLEHNAARVRFQEGAEATAQAHSRISVSTRRSALSLVCG
jgi:hypothetical protein